MIINIDLKSKKYKDGVYEITIILVDIISAKKIDLSKKYII